MNKTNTILKQVQQLSNAEIEYIIFKLLKSKKIIFSNLASVYTFYLEQCDKENRKDIVGLTIPLSAYWDGSAEHKNRKKFIKSKAAYCLIKSKMFFNTPFEKKLKKCIEVNKYSEDENGVPQNN